MTIACIQQEAALLALQAVQEVTLTVAGHDVDDAADHCARIAGRAACLAYARGFVHAALASHHDVVDVQLRRLDAPVRHRVAPGANSVNDSTAGRRADDVRVNVQERRYRPA